MLQRTSSLSGNQKKVEKIIFPQKCDLDDLKQSGNDMHFCILKCWKFNCKRKKKHIGVKNSTNHHKFSGTNFMNIFI
jgi:hypothetical protein